MEYRMDQKNNKIIIKAQSVAKSYRMGPETLEILKGVDLEVNERDYMLIMGPSGAGKSTLLHVLGGLDCPTSGAVYVNDRNFYQLRDSKRSQIRNTEVGFVFQFYHLLPELTAYENVLLPWLISGKHRKMTVKDAHYRVSELLNLVGLEQRMTHRSSELSGGEQQRVAIARSLINAPQVLLADEPSGNLDHESGEKIYELLRQINESLGTAVLIITHNPDLLRYADRRYLMEDGKLKDA